MSDATPRRTRSRFAHVSYKLHMQQESYLCDELDDTTSLLDLLLGERRDESGLDDEWSVDSALAQLGDISTLSHRIICEDAASTHKLELAEVREVENGDGAFWGVDLGLGEGDELE